MNFNVSVNGDKIVFATMGKKIENNFLYTIKTANSDGSGLITVYEQKQNNEFQGVYTRIYFFPDLENRVVYSRHRNKYPDTSDIYAGTIDTNVGIYSVNADGTNTVKLSSDLSTGSDINYHWAD